MYICCAKVKCFCQHIGKNVKCALNPQSDERAREMHDDTAPRSSCVAAACGAIVIYRYPQKQLSTKVDKSKKQTILLLTF